MSKELRQLRKIAEMSQGRAALLGGLDRSRLSLFESGYVQLRPEIVTKLRRAYLRAIRRKALRFNSLYSRVAGRRRLRSAA